MALTDEEVGRRIRELRGDRSQVWLSSRVEGLTQPKLSQIEAGHRRVTTVELAEVAEALNVNPSDLLADVPMERWKTAARVSEGGSIAEGLQTATDTLRLWRQVEADGFDVEVGRRPLQTSPGSSVEQGRAAAEALREALGAGTDPMDQLIEASAHVGLVVRYLPLGGEFDGLCVSDGSGRAVAVLDTSDKWRARQRFSLAHEIGHWLFGDVDQQPTVDEDVYSAAGGDDQETRANVFAANLLLPDAALKRDRPETVEAAVRMAYRYRVSLPMMSYRLTNALGLGDLGNELRALSAADAARRSGCFEAYRSDSDAVGRTGVTPELEFALVDAIEAGALSRRAAGGLVPVFGS